jgi:hypothetical protein
MGMEVITNYAGGAGDFGSSREINNKQHHISTISGGEKPLKRFSKYVSG